MPATKDLNHIDAVSGIAEFAKFALPTAELTNGGCAELIIRRAIRDYGCLILRLSPEEKALLLRLQQAMREFFDAPDAHKEAYRDDGRDYGWSASFEEPAYQPGTKSNLESFDVTAELAVNDKHQHWPAHPDLKQLSLSCWSMYGKLGGRVLELIANAFTLPQGQFANACSSGDLDTMRLLHYPADNGPRDDSTVGIAAHTDFECITLLYQSAPGLEVRTPDGRWLEMPADSGQLVVLFGDMLERWTNGTVQATGHRVRRCEQQRFSIVRFIATNGDEIVAPLPKFVTSKQAAIYGPVRQEAYIEDEMARARAQS